MSEQYPPQPQPGTYPPPQDQAAYQQPQQGYTPYPPQDQAAYQQPQQGYTPYPYPSQDQAAYQQPQQGHAQYPPQNMPNTTLYYQPQPGEKRINKIIYCIITWLVGGLGIHRFLRGQIGLGILWILTGGLFGIGWLVDFIVSIVWLATPATYTGYVGSDDLIFINGKKVN